MPVINWDHPCAIKLRKEIVENILRAYSPNKGKKMNAITTVADPIVEAGSISDTRAEGAKHYVLAIDPTTGEEIKIEVLPIEGEFSQEVEGDEVTIH